MNITNVELDKMQCSRLFSKTKFNDIYKEREKFFILKNDTLPTNRVRQHFLYDYQETIVEYLDHRTKLVVRHNVYLILLH